MGQPAADIAVALGQSCHAEPAIPVIMTILLSEFEYRSALQLNPASVATSATRGMIHRRDIGMRRNGMADLPAEWLAVVKRLPDLE